MNKLLLHPEEPPVCGLLYRWNWGIHRWEYWSAHHGIWKISGKYAGGLHTLRLAKEDRIPSFEDTWAEPFK
jgi:hypothetical protein